ncbi:MAG TPA: hypothetical protein VIC29_16985 [Steroidobacteraceae bacterium]
MLSYDSAHFWTLWDYTSGNEIASGLASCIPSECNPLVDLEGETLAVETSAGLEVYSATDGSLSTLITSPATWWEVATDGSYICGGGTAGLTVWSASGAVIASLPGDYSHAQAFAAPGQIQVAAGPAGANVIQTVMLPSGTATVSAAFQGQFNSWFRDGARFLTNTGATVWIYSSSAVQQDIISFAGGIKDLGGEGTWFWNCEQSCHELDVYKVGASSSATAAYPVATDTSILPSGPTIGLLASGNGTGVMVDLCGSSPVATNFTTPVPVLSAYAATSASQWVVGNGDAALLDGASLGGAPRYFGYGRALSIAGSDQRLALAAASGQIFDGGTLAQEGTIGFPATEIALSSDGSVLAAAGDLEDDQYAPIVALNVYSLPSGTRKYTWPYTVGSPPYLEDFTLSASGTTIAQVIYDPTNTSLCTRQVTAASGGSVLWSDSLCSNFNISDDIFPIRLSPDGTWVAVSQADTSSYTTNLYHNGLLVTAVSGWVVGWLDATHILVNNYTLRSAATGGTNEYVNSTVYDTSGTKVTDLPIPVELKALQVVSTGSIYDPGSNAIYSTTTGAATWTGSRSTGVGAVAGANVVAVYGTQAIAVPY